MGRGCLELPPIRDRQTDSGEMFHHRPCILRGEADKDRSDEPDSVKSKKTLKKQEDSSFTSPNTRRQKNTGNLFSLIKPDTFQKDLSLCQTLNLSEPEIQIKNKIN